LKYLERSQFALQLQPRRLVERPARDVRRVLVHVAQQARARVRASQQVRVLVRVRARASQQALARVRVRAARQARVLVQVLARVPASQQALQQHSPHQQLRSQCRPELCHLR
jgi:hypothetical protein